MIRNFNKTQQLGNLGRTPVLRKTSNGTPVTDFSLATTSRWLTKDNEERTKTEWHKVVVWGRLAESVCQIAEKGDLVYVEGKITYREYEKDGIKRQITEIEGNQVLKMESKRTHDK